MIEKLISKTFLGTLSSWVFALLCFAYPISAIISSILGVSSTPINIIYRAINLTFSLYIIVVSVILYRCTISKYAVPMLIFLVLYLCRIVWDTSFADVNAETTPIEIYSFYIGSIIIPIIAILLTFKYVDTRKTVLRVFYTLILGNLLLFYFFMSQNGWTISPSMLLSRAEVKGADDESLIVNPISFGLYGGYLVLLCLSLLLLCQKKFSATVLNFAGIFLFLGLFNLIIASSRGPFLFSFFGILVILRIHFVYVKKTYMYYGRVIIILILVSTSIGVAYRQMIANDIEIGIFERLVNMKESLENGEKEERQELYIEAFEMFKSSPIIGKQFVLESTGAYPHNVILEVLMSTGMIGLFFYILSLGVICVKLISFRGASVYYAVFISLIILSIGISLSTGNLYQSVDNWNLMAALIALPRKENELMVNIK